MEVPDGWKKENAMPVLYRIEGGSKQLQPSQPALSPQNNYGNKLSCKPCPDPWRTGEWLGAARMDLS